MHTRTRVSLQQAPVLESGYAGYRQGRLRARAAQRSSTCRALGKLFYRKPILSPNLSPNLYPVSQPVSKMGSIGPSALKRPHKSTKCHLPFIRIHVRSPCEPLSHQKRETCSPHSHPANPTTRCLTKAHLVPVTLYPAVALFLRSSHHQQSPAHLHACLHPSKVGPRSCRSLLVLECDVYTPCQFSVQVPQLKAACR